MIGTELYRGQGFGNQLWVYATLRSLAIDQDLDFSIIGSHRFKGKDFMDLNFGLPTLRSTARKPRERTPGAFTSYLREELIREPEYNFDVSPADVNFFQLKPNTLLDGNMQSLSYISAHKNEISNWFKVPGETFDGCVINFRGGEYKGISNVFLGPDYYKNAIEHVLSINANMKFLVVTDDAEKAREYFPNYRIISSGGVKIIAGRIYISPPSKMIGRDFAILQNARYLILSNSSFSWWGAWTNQMAEVVIAPKYWAAHNVSKSFWSTAEIAEPTWTWQSRES
jgi:hypothetical protein